jgi:DNA-directed RNA polymerase subunit M/transcription elongation factor TFIIS
MLYYWAIFAGAMKSCKKCPGCGKLQYFKGKKRGEVVACKKCGHHFQLK